MANFEPDAVATIATEHSQKSFIVAKTAVVAVAKSQRQGFAAREPSS